MAGGECAGPADDRSRRLDGDRRHGGGGTWRRAGSHRQDACGACGRPAFPRRRARRRASRQPKCKDEFGARPRMLGAEETFEITGHPIGGVCPFGLKTPLPVYMDVSLRAFSTVYPAGGSRNTSVEIPTERLFELVGDRWVDLCRLPDEAVGR